MDVISVTGLGYVGLPVAVAMASKFKVVGFDVHKKRIEELQNGHDRTKEVSSEELKAASITFTSEKENLRVANFHIVAVPTPVDEHKIPDLTPMLKASETIGSILKKGDIVVFESTVYPGVCEDECLPILEKFSSLKGGVDFKIGYSPERINPGDHQHRFANIKKIVSAQDHESLEKVASVYGSVVTAGVHKVSSIKVAEAAKVIENTQRDLNIALVNELSLIFEKLKIDTLEVIEAAATKWNFIKFKPGLVGGHCIGVDPYYLTFKAQALGYHPQVILSGRRINDYMGKYVAEKTIKELIHAGHLVKGANVLILGLSFKENCPDLRNSKVYDIFLELKEFGVNVSLFDPMIDKSEAHEAYQIEPLNQLSNNKFKAVILAVSHQCFLDWGAEKISDLCEKNGVFIDVKGVFQKQLFEKKSLTYWRL